MPTQVSAALGVTITFLVAVLCGCVSGPKVPPTLAVTGEQAVFMHAYAKGVQIYVCASNAASPGTFEWRFKAPEAMLFADTGSVIGSHYAGPTWEYNDESKVVGRVLQCVNAPTPGAIPWLLIEATSHDGRGKFADVTSIQRVNTVGGGAPATRADAAHEGQEIRVPYTAEYYLYRQAR